MSIDAETEVPATVLGQALGVSRKRIEQLAGDNIIPRNGRGKFPLLAGIAGYIAWLKDDQRRASKSASASKVQDAKAEEISLRVADRKQTHLAEAQAEVLALIDEYAGPLRSDVLAIPARVTADITLRRKIEDQIDEAFGAAGERAAAAADRVKPLRPIVGAKAKDQPARLGRRKPTVPAKRGSARAA